MRTLSFLLLAALPVSAAAADPAASRSGDSARPRGVLIDFTASWCGPCQKMSPLVKRLYREGFPVRKVDVDENPELARKFNITGIPAFVLMIDGREVDRAVGETSEAKLRQMLARIPAESSPAATAPTEIARAVPPPTAAPAAARSAAPAPAPAVPAARSVPATFAPEFEQPVVRANLDRRDSLDRVEVAARVVGDPMAASVRIRVKDKSGVNFGSGTIVDSRPGRTIILSCGHIFRGVEDDSRIEIDVFDGGRSETYLGKVLRFDLEGDVGLLAIATDGWLPVCEVAKAAERVAVGDRATSIGCGKGDLPSEMQVQVTRLNRYIGPENVECTGVPIQGRSGGGLFDDDCRLVGVCIAADNRDQRGLYAGLAPIHELLDRCELSFVYRQSLAANEAPADPADSARSERRPPAVEIAAPPAATGRAVAPVVAASHTDQEDGGPGTRPATAGANPGPGALAAAGEEDTWGEDPYRAEVADAELAEALRSAGDAEVICIIRAHDDPQANSRVVIINRASPKFVSYLTGELREQPQTVAHREPEEQAATGAAETAPRSPGFQNENEFGADHADPSDGAPPRPYRRAR